MTKVSTILASVAFLFGCSPDHRELNDQVVCVAGTKKAYIVRHNIGDTSFVYPAPQFQELCK